MRSFSWACAGTFPPLVTAIGGLVAQEALIAVTGKFTPLHQWVRHCHSSPPSYIVWHQLCDRRVIQVILVN